MSKWKLIARFVSDRLDATLGGAQRTLTTDRYSLGMLGALRRRAIVRLRFAEFAEATTTTCAEVAALRLNFNRRPSAEKESGQKPSEATFVENSSTQPQVGFVKFFNTEWSWKRSLADPC